MKTNTIYSVTKMFNIPSINIINMNYPIKITIQVFRITQEYFFYL